MIVPDGVQRCENCDEPIWRPGARLCDGCRIAALEAELAAVKAERALAQCPYCGGKWYMLIPKDNAEGAL
ncbi:MAG: hypothetical protein M0R06_01370 [Sphaerochaeta sp.]|jgi:NMD protein affecting ribosome stability and mRNA decay|nr:hypothetical protein [Sphaerochaeta sp.]